jgi:hypothetical protein
MAAPAAEFLWGRRLGVFQENKKRRGRPSFCEQKEAKKLY